MSGNTVNITGNANFQSVHRAWQLADARAESFNRQLLRIHGISGRNKAANDAFFASMNHGLMQFTQKMAGFGGALGAIAKTVQLIRAEYEHLKSEQTAKAGVQVTAAKAQRAAILNLPGDDRSLNVAQLNQRVNQFAQKEGVSPATLYDAAAAAFSSKGASVDAASALEAVEISAALQPEDADTIQQNTQAILALKKRSPDTSMKDIAGFLIASQQASRQVGVREFAENAAPAIAQAVDFGDSLQFASGLYATITQGAEDAMGRVSRNAMVRFQQQLLTETAAAGRTDLKTTEQRLAYVRSDDGSELRAKLLGALDSEAATADKAGLAGEAKAFMTLVGLLQPVANDQQKLLEDNLRLIPQLQGAATVLETTLQRVNREAIQQTAAAERIGKSSAEVARLIDTKGAQAAVVREQLQDLRSAMGSSDLGIKAQALLEDLNSNGQPDFGALDAGVESLKQSVLAVTKSYTLPSATPGGLPTRIEGRPLNPLEQEQIKTLERLRESIAGLRAEQAGAAPVNEGRLQDERRTRTEQAVPLIERVAKQLPEGDRRATELRTEFIRQVEEQPQQDPERVALAMLAKLGDAFRGNAVGQATLETAANDLRAKTVREQVPGTAPTPAPTLIELERESRIKEVKETFEKVVEYSTAEGTQGTFNAELTRRADADRTRAPEVIGAELVEEFRNRFPVGLAQDSLAGIKREMLDQRALNDGIQASSPQQIESVREVLGKANQAQPELNARRIGIEVSQKMAETPELDPARVAIELVKERSQSAPVDLQKDFAALVAKLEALRAPVDTTRQQEVAVKLEEARANDKTGAIEAVSQQVKTAAKETPEVDSAGVALTALKEQIAKRQRGGSEQQAEAAQLLPLRAHFESLLGIEPVSAESAFGRRSFDTPQPSEPAAKPVAAPTPAAPVVNVTPVTPTPPKPNDAKPVAAPTPTPAAPVVNVTPVTPTPPKPNDAKPVAAPTPAPADSTPPKKPSVWDEPDEKKSAFDKLLGFRAGAGLQPSPSVEASMSSQPVAPTVVPTPARDTAAFDSRAIEAMTRAMTMLNASIGKLIDVQSQPAQSVASASRGEAPLYQPQDRYRQKAAMRESRYVG